MISRRDVLKAGVAAGAGNLLSSVGASAGPGSGQYEIRNNTSTWTIQGCPSQSAFGITIGPSGQPIELRVPPGTYSMKGHVQANDQWVSFFAWKDGSPHIPLTAAHLLTGSPDGDFVVTVTNGKNGLPVVDAPEINGWYRWKDPLLK